MELEGISYFLVSDETNTYDYERLGGIAHEIYERECARKGSRFEFINKNTFFGGYRLQHPITGEWALGIYDENEADVPDEIATRLVSRATVEADGWLDLPEYEG